MNFSVLILIGLILGILGGIFLIIISIVKKYYDNLYINCTESTIGVFSGASERLGLTDMNDVRSYYPIYKYVVNDNEYYCKGNQGAYSSKRVNTKNKTVYYNPNNPKESYTDRQIIDFIIKLFKVLGWMFLGIGFCLIMLKFVFIK